VLAADVAVPITHLVSVKVLHVFGMKVPAGSFATGGIWAVIAVLGVEVVIYVTVEMIWTVKPGAGTDEDAACEPLRAIIAVWSAVIGRSFVVTVRAHRSRAYVDADLSLRCRSRDCNPESSHCSCRKKLESVHVSPLPI
jgi:hypothetical protein